MSERVAALHGSLIDILSVMNRPNRDDALLREAGVELDRALFQVIVGIARFGPIRIVDLADRAGRDHTTVSRQVAKLESLGLVERCPDPADRRVRAVAVSAAGRHVVEKIDAARQRLARAVFADWNADDLDTLVGLMRRLADTLGDDRRIGIGG